MSITIKQLEMLSREYHFDLGEARRFLANDPKKPGRPSNKDSDTETPSKSLVKNYPKSLILDKKSDTKRSPSGYNLFVKNQGLAITEASKQWKALTDSAREKWNKKAKVIN